MVLTQLNDKNLEQPIAFSNDSLNDYEDRFSYVEKKAFFVVRALKNFKHLLSLNKIQQV